MLNPQPSTRTRNPLTSTLAFHFIQHSAFIIQHYSSPRSILQHRSREGFFEVVAAFTVLGEVQAFVFIAFADAQAAAQGFSDHEQNKGSDGGDAVSQQNRQELIEDLMPVPLDRAGDVVDRLDGK